MEGSNRGISEQLVVQKCTGREVFGSDTYTELNTQRDLSKLVISQSCHFQTRHHTACAWIYVCMHTRFSLYIMLVLRLPCLCLLYQNCRGILHFSAMRVIFFVSRSEFSVYSFYYELTTPVYISISFFFCVLKKNFIQFFILKNK